MSLDKLLNIEAEKGTSAYEQGNFNISFRHFRLAYYCACRVHGPDHPDTATLPNNLATLYQAQGDLAKAGPLYQRALEINELTKPAGESQS